MSLARQVKLAFLRGSQLAGLGHLVLNSSWRRERLLILCWHNLAHDDEHLWNPQLCLAPQTFRARLNLLRSTRCNVLPLGEALARLRQGTLPARAVALTIDDGDSSTAQLAWPMLREFGFPATLYWTTYYSTKSYAVFDPMLSYLLWKARNRRLDLREPAVSCDLSSGEARHQAFQTIYQHAQANAWDGERKENFLATLARDLGIDYPAIKARRILHLITPAEAQTMQREGIDLQLHTHRHRVPKNQELFSRELHDNANMLRDAGAAHPSHFCYPSGSYLPEFAEWLRRDQIVSATTCQPGFAERDTDFYFLPRFLDQEDKPLAEFAGWVSGVASWMVRPQSVDQHSFRQ
jgi:peptidoglycan/xylan/chitin deacetylase (PgdA/CDA1 family)